MSQKPKILLYTAPTPNTHKVSITLEELGLDYEVRVMQMQNVEQKEPWFLKINPNGRVPALTDTLPNGEAINLFESGSIQQYLIDRYDTDHKISYPRGTKEFYLTNSWLFFQNAGIGPMQGQTIHFTRYHHSNESVAYSLDRYTHESRRLYRTVDTHLKETGNDFLIGSKPTIADFAIFSWADIGYFAGLDLSEFTYVQEWMTRLKKRPAVAKGLKVPFEGDLKTLSERKEYLDKNKELIKKAMEEERNK